MRRTCGSHRSDSQGNIVDVPLTSGRTGLLERAVSLTCGPPGTHIGSATKNFNQYLALDSIRTCNCVVNREVEALIRSSRWFEFGGQGLVDRIILGHLDTSRLWRDRALRRVTGKQIPCKFLLAE